jgi:predicted amidohydrolase
MSNIAPTASIAGTDRPVRVATVNYGQRRIARFEDFAEQLEYWVRVAAGYACDFVVFPELWSLQLLSMASTLLSPSAAIAELSRFTPALQSLLRELALRHRIHIVGGSHPSRRADSEVRNTCHIALRDGSLHARDKLHITPNERRCWGITGGDSAAIIQTDCGPIGVMICYDAEFPELARHLVDQGALILFVPFCTDTREGYLRVRHCSAARAIENQCYVVLAGNVGNLPGVYNFDIQYAQSVVLTPCDTRFARDGIAAEASANVEMMVFADLDLDALRHARRSGSVLNLADRRHDLYALNWRER